MKGMYLIMCKYIPSIVCRGSNQTQYIYRSCGLTVLTTCIYRFSILICCSTCLLDTHLSRCMYEIRSNIVLSWQRRSCPRPPFPMQLYYPLLRILCGTLYLLFPRCLLKVLGVDVGGERTHF